MKRQVRCIREMSRSKTTANTIILEDRQCAEPKPVDLSVCNTKDCPAYWHKGDWESVNIINSPFELCVAKAFYLRALNNWTASIADARHQLMIYDRRSS